MKNLTFQITPDSNKDSESIQMGRDLKLSCHVDAQPQDKVNYTWYKNGASVFPTDTLIVLRSDPDMPPGTSSLEIVDMKFRDQATYSCVANFPGSSVPELRVDVNITQSSGERERWECLKMPLPKSIKCGCLVLHVIILFAVKENVIL